MLLGDPDAAAVPKVGKKKGELSEGGGDEKKRKEIVWGEEYRREKEGERLKRGRWKKGDKECLEVRGGTVLLEKGAGKKEGEYRHRRDEGRKG